MTPRWLLVVWFFVASSASGRIENADHVDLKDRFEKCSSLQDDEQRLNCYDSMLEVEEEPKPGRLSANEPSYFVYAKPLSADFGEEHHAEFFISIKYPLGERKFANWKVYAEDHGSDLRRVRNTAFPNRVLFIYNGLFDFHMLHSELDLYDSSPVISKRQNPGLAGEYEFKEGRGKLRLGWFHESNGQVLEEGDLARFGQLQSQGGEDFALSEVSRGWDYAQIRWEHSSTEKEDEFDPDWFRYRVEYRLFCNCQGLTTMAKEDAIWWEQGNEARIADYDGLRVMAEFPLGRVRDNPLLGRLELKSGTRDMLLRNVGGKFTLTYKVWNTRFILFYFDGYGRDPSTYHLRKQYAGFGIELR